MSKEGCQLTEAGPSREGSNHITDHYLRFYFRFLADRQAQLTLGTQEQALAEITGQMDDFINQYAWKEICREWVLCAGATGILPDWPEQVGSVWNSRTRGGHLGINFPEKTTILGECVWNLQPGDREEIGRCIS